MAYKNENLTLLQTAGDRASLFVYVTADDNASTAKAANYFDGAIGIPAQIRTGDLIILSTTDGVELVKATVSGGHVTVAGAAA